MKNRFFAMFAIALALAAGALGALTPATTAAPQVWTPQWNHAYVDNGVNDLGFHSSIKFNPVNKWPYVSYYDAQNGHLRMAYLSDGRGTSCSDGWNCFKVAGSGGTQAGFDNQLGFDSSGNAWIAYSDPFLAKGMLAKVETSNFNAVSTQIVQSYTGVGSNPPGSDIVRFATLAMWGNSPVGAFYTYNNNANTAEFTGLWAGGEGFHSEISLIDGGPDQPYTFGYYPSLDWDSVYNVLVIGFRGNGNAILPINHSLNYAVRTPAKHASCPEPDNDSYWDCKLIDATPETGNYISFHASKNANDPMQVAYYDATNHQIKYAKKVGGSVYCNNNPLADIGWECSSVATVANGTYSGGLSMVVDASGVPTIAWYDTLGQANGVLKVARYVGSGGNCGNGSANGKWQCSVADNGAAGFGAKHNVGQNPSITLSPDGRVYISYYDATAQTLKVVNERGAQPDFDKTFNKSTLKVGDSIQATYSIHNNMSVPLTNLQFTDSFSPTLTLAPNSVVSNTCGGDVAYFGNGDFRWYHGLLAPGANCTLKANGVAFTAGQRLDTTGVLFSNEAGTVPGVDTTLFISAIYKLFLPVVQR